MQQYVVLFFVEPYKSVYCGEMIGWMQTLFYLGQEASADLGYVSNATTSRCFAVIINQNKTGKIKTEQAKTEQNRQQPNRQTNSRWDTRTAPESLAMTLHVEIQFEETFRPSPCLEVCSVYLRGGRSDKFDVNSRSPWKTTNSRNNFDRQQNDG